jgi:4-alpha-glucanotransferase
VAPREVYQGADRSARFWLLAVQLYGIRSRTNWGHGDFGDLARLLDLAASLGAAGVGLNPLHALMNESEENVSPYSPSSRLFLNFLYIDVDALPEFSAVAKDDLRSRITALREAEMVDYLGVAAVKREALRRCYTRFKEDGRESDDFEQFRHERGEALEKFARFEAAREHGSNVAAEELRYHAYVQWRADRQLRACRDKAGALGLPIGLYLDLAVGVRSDGADAESAPGVYFRGVTIGAPPDLLNLQGQDWGLTAYHPRSIERQKFAPFREMLAANMRYAGALRVDHVLWLNRVYLVPRGLAPSEGCYIHYPLEALLGVLAIESDANRCCVIGEDLGTVPPELREALKRWGVWTYHVMQFERDETGAFRSADMYQERALATFATHDLPPFAAWLSGSDLKLKRGIGIDPGESDAERARATSRLASALAATGEAIQFDQIARFLAATPTRLVAVGLEDALALRELTNVPGTTTQHPNWRRKLPVLLEDLAGDERLRRLSAAFDDHGRSIAAATNK